MRKQRTTYSHSFVPPKNEQSKKYFTAGTIDLQQTRKK